MNSLLAKSVKIVEVGARDGLQNEARISTESKIALIDQLSRTGLKQIEAGAFVSAKWVPQMADSAEVLAKIERRAGVVYSALTPNLQGFEQALASGADQVAIFTSASQGFCQRNINCSIAESLKRFEPLMQAAKAHHIPVRGYLSCVADCPYDGATKPEQVASVASDLLALGCYEISLGDTIGTGTPLRIARMLDAVKKEVSVAQLAVHFHDTWGQALANLYQALTMGVATIDSSVAGLGGCPYAKGAAGNVATEDVLYLCQGLGIETGVDLPAVAEAGWQICQALGRLPTSKVALALASQRITRPSLNNK
ncbi:hydroxymethylglutaryl-CoA lyase [Vibrio navarrensis]|uniref:hydroxymethylglutaryl-CoA lyase n=1 Tax=Vibrio navarrensis TaxID=29495 RepID=UPI00186A1A1C|nr:hydroxymethylglutaryl-CoA lyase [Vibrio navarrensis]EJK2113375.1 hydroxymethylglutaryl-CoA lyase [Vibrio navarrensis]MBE4576911.1 hydroxymethylglutaryl-CoA lyase [Vibrio navarrensis]MBE4595823.1 hydroxymethylglutaryl-CoA lyase [Vibrio navarrensis]